MALKDFCQKKVVAIESGQTILAAVRKMKLENAGDVVVLAPNTQRPVGILTDRDIVNSIVAENLSPEKLNVEDVMVHQLKVLSEHDGIREAAITMRDYGIRRLPIVNDFGEIVGICTLDDLHQLLADELSHLAEVPTRQISVEKKHGIRCVVTN